MVFEWFRETFGRHLKNDIDLSRRKFLKGAVSFGIASVLASFPFRVFAGSQKDFIEVTITKDRNRNSIGAIIDNYCSLRKFLTHYNTRTIQDGINKLVRIHNPHIKNPSKVKVGDRILIPKVILKNPIQEAAKIQDTKPIKVEQPEPSNINGWQSPFGGNKKIDLHYCYDGTPNNDVPNGLIRIKKDGKLYPKRIEKMVKVQICPHDLFNADRSNGRTHNALDCYGKIGTKLYPIKPGVVDVAGRAVDFGLLPGGGNVVRINTDNGLTYLYLHLNKIYTKVGDKVDFNTCVGELGTTGNATPRNPHVHITLRRGKQPLDPLIYLKDYVV